jgi:HlyD family secretion protein
MNFRFLVPIVILAAGAGGAFAVIKSRPPTQPITIEEKAWLVDTTEVERHAHQPTLVLYGRIETPRDAHLTAALSADVMKVHVREGDRVESGQILISLDNREAQLLLRQREAEAAEVRALVEIENQQQTNNRDAWAREKRVLALSRRAVSRAKDLAKSNVGSKSQLDAARQEEEQRSMAVDARQTAIRGHGSRMAQLEAKLAKAQALRDRANLDVERTQVKAPFAGPISSVSVSPGDRVGPGAPLLSLFDSQALELRAQVPTRHVTTIRRSLEAGEAVHAQSAVGGIAVTATLDRLGTKVARGSGGVDALFALKEGAHNLPLGLTIELSVELTPESNTIALPSKALYGAGHVYRVEGERIKRVSVTRVGEMRNAQGNFVLVRSKSLKPGDQIVSTQLPNAIDGLKVTVAGS